MFARVRPPRVAEAEELPRVLGAARTNGASFTTPAKRGVSSKRRDGLMSPASATMPSTPFVIKAPYNNMTISSTVGAHGLPDRILFRDAASTDGEASVAFEMDGVLDPCASQKQVWDAVGLEHVDAVLNGFNSTMFAYGRTASGKTYTIIGPADVRGDGWSFEELEAEGGGDDENSESSSVLGLVPRAIHALIQRAHALRAERHFTVRFACAEIYNKSLFDLCAGAAPVAADDISAASTERVEVPESRMTTAAAEKLTWHEIDARNGHENVAMRTAQRLIQHANACRMQASTHANADSSRSHVLYMCRVTSLGTDGASRDATLSVVDLAGSESLDMKERTASAREAETKAINSSLHTLTRVVHAFATAPPGSRPAHVPYRESLLTLLLKDAIGGNCRTSIIVTLGTDEEQLLHSYKSCQFARLARGVRNCARENKVFDPSNLVVSLRAQVAELVEAMASRDALLADVDRDLRLSHLLDLACAPDFDVNVITQVLDTWLQRVHVSPGSLHRSDALLSLRQLAAVASAATELVKSTGASTILDAVPTDDACVGPSPVKMVDASTSVSPAQRKRGMLPATTDREMLEHALASLLTRAEGLGAEDAHQHARLSARAEMIRRELAGPISAPPSPADGIRSCIPVNHRWHVMPEGALLDWQVCSSELGLQGGECTRSAATEEWITLPDDVSDLLEACNRAEVPSVVLRSAPHVSPVLATRSAAYTELTRTTRAESSSLLSQLGMNAASLRLARDTPFACFILDPAACLQTCLHTGRMRALQRVTHVAMEGYLDKRRRVRGGYVRRAYRLTPAGLQQLLDGPACRDAVSRAMASACDSFSARTAASCAGVSKVKTTFVPGVRVAAESAPTLDNVHGCFFVVSVQQPSSDAITKMQFVASSIHDAAAWVRAINAVATPHTLSPLVIADENARALIAWLTAHTAARVAHEEALMVRHALHALARDRRTALLTTATRLSLPAATVIADLDLVAEAVPGDVASVAHALGLTRLHAIPATTISGALDVLLTRVRAADGTATLARRAGLTNFKLSLICAYEVRNEWFSSMCGGLAFPRHALSSIMNGSSRGALFHVCAHESETLRVLTAGARLAEDASTASPEAAVAEYVRKIVRRDAAVPTGAVHDLLLLLLRPCARMSDYTRCDSDEAGVLVSSSAMVHTAHVSLAAVGPARTPSSSSCDNSIEEAGGALSVPVALVHVRVSE